MNKRVMVRFPQVGRDTILIPAEVIREKGGVMHVRVEGELRARDVNASETVAMHSGGRPGTFGQQVMPQKAFPTARGALATVLR